MKTINREELKEMLENNSKDFHLIEVLSKDAFNDFHLPNAVNIPVDHPKFDEQVNEEASSKDKPIVVYCKDKDCPASKKAAKQIEELGYKNVMDYTEGKSDWRSAGYPIQ